MIPCLLFFLSRVWLWGRGCPYRQDQGVHQDFVKGSTRYRNASSGFADSSMLGFASTGEGSLWLRFAFASTCVPRASTICFCLTAKVETSSSHACSQGRQELRIATTFALRVSSLCALPRNLATIGIPMTGIVE